MSGGLPRAPRIAVGQISQESNSFVAVPTELEQFRGGYLLHDQEIDRLNGSDTEVAGALAVCAAAGAEVIPLIATRACSGGPLSAACYGTLKGALLDRLRAAGPVDGVFLSLHGSMLAAGEDDPEGDLLVGVRGVVGLTVPIVATLDLHANVTPRMVRQATALVSYSRYPHDDVRTTGERGVRLLLAAVRGETRPTMALAKVPMLVSGCEGQTFGDGPMAHLTARARELEKSPGVLSVSCFHVHPYLDVPGLGSGAIVITDGDEEMASKMTRSLAEEFWTRRRSFVPEVLSVGEAVARGRAIEGGPVLLVDAADCAGGGAAGDSVALMRELLALGVTEPTYLMVVDPDVAAACTRAGKDAEVTLDLGYQLDPAWGRPLPVTGQVVHLSDGRFRYTGGLFGGTEASMGPSAVLAIGALRVLVMSQPTYDWADEQFRAVRLDPIDAKFVWVKNPMNYRFAYRDVAKAAIVVDPPGPTPAHVLNLPYRRITRPAFPFDEDIPGLRAKVVQGNAAYTG